MYKNARVYRVMQGDIYTENNFAFLNQVAREAAFVALTGQEQIRMGFVQPYPEATNSYMYFEHGCIFFAIKTQWKDIPASALLDILNPRLKVEENSLGRALTKREKAELKEAVLQELMPRALAKSKVLQGYIDITHSLVVLNTSSSNDAEMALSLLRKVVGSMPAVPWLDGHLLGNCLNLWALDKDLPQNLIRGHATSFKAPDECGAVSSFKNHVFDERVTEHLQDKLCTKLELHWPEKLSFCIDVNGLLSKLSWEDAILATNEELGWEDIPARIKADLLLEVSTLRDLFMVISNRVSNTLLPVPENNLTEQVLAAARGYLQQQTTLTADQLASRFNLTEKEAKVLGTTLVIGNYAAVSFSSSGQYIYTAKTAPLELDAFSDPLYNEAKGFVIKSRRASVSAIQRFLRIGYNRAARIIERMEVEGIVSKPNHEGMRKVLAPAPVEGAE